MSIMFLRLAIGALVLWLLWRFYTALTAASRASSEESEDEWTEVLEAIDDLPETSEIPEQKSPPKLLLPKRYPQDDEPTSTSNLETIIIREAEAALSRMREDDEMIQLAAYHEITVYEKLSQMPVCDMSQLTQEKITYLRHKAWQIMHPPEPT